MRHTGHERANMRWASQDSTSLGRQKVPARGEKTYLRQVYEPEIGDSAVQRSRRGFTIVTAVLTTAPVSEQKRTVLTVL